MSGVGLRHLHFGNVLVSDPGAGSKTAALTQVETTSCFSSERQDPGRKKQQWDEVEEHWNTSLQVIRY